MNLMRPPACITYPLQKLARKLSVRTASLLLLAAVTLSTSSTVSAEQNLQPRFGSPEFVWGANYMPSRSLTSYQVWWRFDPERVNREIGYAKKLNLNALRMPLSYEYWKENPNAIQANFDNLLEIAKKHNIKILISLFSIGGVPPTQANLKNEDPTTGADVDSPGIAVVSSPERWRETNGYIDWFMERYKDDSRLLAIELISDPADRGGRSMDFAGELLARAASMRGSVPLTVGCVGLSLNEPLLEKGLDVMQSRVSFVESEGQALWVCKTVQKYVEKHKKPAWLTDWERIRTSGPGLAKTIPSSREERLPGYTQFCEVLKKNNIQGFFGSLMLRPSVQKVHSHLRWFTGVFHEDGSVWSLEDARSIADDSNLTLTEKQELPGWTKGVDWDSDLK